MQAWDDSQDIGPAWGLTSVCHCVQLLLSVTPGDCSHLLLQASPASGFCFPRTGAVCLHRGKHRFPVSSPVLHGATDTDSQHTAPTPLFYRGDPSGHRRPQGLDPLGQSLPRPRLCANEHQCHRVWVPAAGRVVLLRCQLQA